jgi:hypothetical protein
MHLLEFRPFLRLCCVEEINYVLGEKAEIPIIFIEGSFVEFSRRIGTIIRSGFIDGN